MKMKSMAMLALVGAMVSFSSIAIADDTNNDNTNNNMPMGNSAQTPADNNNMDNGISTNPAPSDNNMQNNNMNNPGAADEGSPDTATGDDDY